MSAAVLACSSGIAPDEQLGAGGFFTAAERPTVHVFLYDDDPGPAAEPFFVQLGNVDVGAGYWWGTYVEHGDSLRMTLNVEQLAPDTLRLRYPGAPIAKGGGGLWRAHGEEFAVELAGQGALTFRRTADEPPGA